MINKKSLLLIISAEQRERTLERAEEFFSRPPTQSYFYCQGRAYDEAGRPLKETYDPELYLRSSFSKYLNVEPQLLGGLSEQFNLTLPKYREDCICKAMGVEDAAVLVHYYVDPEVADRLITRSATRSSLRNALIDNMHADRVPHQLLFEQAQVMVVYRSTDVEDAYTLFVAI